MYYKNSFLGSTPVRATLPVGDVELKLVNETTRLNKVVTIVVPESGADKIELPIP